MLNYNENYDCSNSFSSTNEWVILILISSICTVSNRLVELWSSPNLIKHLIIKFWVKPGCHIPLTYLRSSRWLELTTFGDLFQWVPSASVMDRPRSQIGMKCKIKLAQFSAIPPVNMDWIVLLGYVASAGDVHIKYFHHRQSPPTASLPAKLNSAQLRSQASGQCLGQIMIRW